MSNIKYSTRCRYCGKEVLFVESGNPLKKSKTYCCEPEKQYVLVFQKGGSLFVTEYGLPIRGKAISAHEYNSDAVYGYRVHWCDTFPGHINTGNNKKNSKRRR